VVSEYQVETSAGEYGAISPGDKIATRSGMRWNTCNHEITAPGFVVMINVILSCIVLFFLITGGCQMSGSLKMTVDQLRCEYQNAPEGIDVIKPRLSWMLNTERPGACQKAYQIIVADADEAIVRNEGNLWDTGKIPSDQTVQVEYQGTPLRTYQRCYWKVRVWDNDGDVSPWSPAARWSMGILGPAGWKARWIGAPPTPSELRDGKSRKEGDRVIDPAIPPCPLLRKSFTLAGPVKRARVYVTALGNYELRINGKRVGDQILAPGYTDYRQRVLYQAYDVTDLLKTGANAIGAMLADGWYAGRLGPIEWFPDFPRRGVYGFDRRLLMQLVVETADGKEQTVISDGSWKIFEDGPILSADHFLGETYDQSKEPAGWDTPGFDDSRWAGVSVDLSIKIELTAQNNEPIRITHLIKPVGLREWKPGVYIFDMGQNIVGWCRIRLSGPAGQAVTVRHAEVLDDEGGIYTANLKSAKQTDQYILDGGPAREYEPHFTYHSFRYVEVAGLNMKPRLEDLMGCVFHSDAPLAGSFECSNPMLNRLWLNILWTQRGNLHSIPTDCPNRAERMGWMGDAQVFCQTSMFNMDMAAFYTKWLTDVRDAQNEKGFYSSYAPDPCRQHYGSPGWADAGVVVPWRMYQNYADTRILRQQFESARRFIDAIEAESPDLIWNTKSYGDWLNGDTLKADDYPTQGGEVPQNVYATAFFAYSTEILSRTATVLGDKESARHYAELAEKIRTAFINQFVDPDGKITGNTQSGYALALNFNLLPENLRQRAAEHMAQAVKKYDTRISTGIQGTIRLMLELTRWGYNDLAYQLMESRRFPSWLYSVDQGATTIWERWDGYVKGRGFQDPVMNSFNHYAIGAVGEWMVRVILGLNPDEQQPGYKHFTIHPQPGGSLTWAKGEYHSIRGRIAVGWKIENSRFILDVTIPPNTLATVYLPASDPEKTTLNGKSIELSPFISNKRTENKLLILNAQPGTWQFACPYKL
jgi:alpha-L-rhamnosidase